MGMTFELITQLEDLLLQKLLLCFEVELPFLQQGLVLLCHLFTALRYRELFLLAILPQVVQLGKFLIEELFD
jgi:hypothetical protein